jgi:hypothetical protein
MPWNKTTSILDFSLIAHFFSPHQVQAYQHRLNALQEQIKRLPGIELTHQQQEEKYNQFLVKLKQKKFVFTTSVDKLRGTCTNIPLFFTVVV